MAGYSFTNKTPSIKFSFKGTDKRVQGKAAKVSVQWPGKYFSRLKHMLTFIDKLSTFLIAFAWEKWYVFTLDDYLAYLLNKLWLHFMRNVILV